ncbi:MAG: hypothetical protein CMN30_08060 [Sandaracinus sp.]|nr:hypothetical protein [Sandaracinus sp.]
MGRDRTRLGRTRLRDGLRAAWEERRRARVAVALAFFVGFLVWGPDGRVPLLDPVLAGLDPVVAWMVRFVAGALAMVALPWAAVRFVVTDEPRAAAEWGLGLGDWRRGLPIALGLGLVLAAGTSVMAPGDPEVRATYPLFQPAEPDRGLFWTYELVYLFFFMANELGMRGLLLFGLRRWTQSPAAAVILAAIPQLVWHLHKPASEMWMAGFWGLLVGALALGLRSAWWGVLFHWMSNVALDFALISRPPD